MTTPYRQELDEALICWETGATKEAFQLWEAAADRGNMTAQWQTGLCYELGTGTTQNLPLAAAYYEKARSAGCADAQFSLGTLYRDGRGVSQDESRAIKLLLAAAAGGVVKAHTALGSMFATGRGVTEDYLEASRWFRIAAHRGDPDAQFMLGVLYLRGLGLERDLSVAAEWMRLAANSGDAEAQFNLGVMCYRGEGVARDLVHAHAWLNVSKVSGYARAAAFLDVVAVEMTPVELGRAIRIAQEIAERADATTRSTPRLSGDARDRLTRQMGRTSPEAEYGLQLVLGERMLSQLLPSTKAFLIKAEDEFASDPTECGLSVSVLLIKAFEREFNHRVRDYLADILIGCGHSEYPKTGALKIVRAAGVNEHMTIGQTIQFIKNDRALATFLSKAGMDPKRIVTVCDEIARTRNSVIHEDFDASRSLQLTTLILKSGFPCIVPVVR